jgi:GntR family transcriptional regulator, transcriptional repressor for pyruvate dehydrogenase complex
MKDPTARSMSPATGQPTPGSQRFKFGDIIYWDILQQIRIGRYAPDQKLPAEKILALQHGVSRPIVRQALQRLRADGLIYSRKGSGSYIQGLGRGSAQTAAETPRLVKSIADVQNVYEFRIAIEGEIAYAAALHADEAAIAEIEHALVKMEQALGRGDPALEEDMDFHLAVAKATRNQFFTEALRMMRPHMTFVMELVMRLSSVDPEEHTGAVQAQHAAIAERIREKDPEGARAAMRTMITNARNRVFHGIDSRPAAAAAVETAHARPTQVRSQPAE